MFLQLVSNIKILVTASYVLGKYESGVFMSVFCGARESIEWPRDEECLRDNAVSLYFSTIPHFTRLEEPKVFKNNVRDIYSASPKLYIFLVLKISYVEIYTMFPRLSMHIFDFFHFFTISWQSGFPGVFAC